jgi:hypothetical protein
MYLLSDTQRKDFGFNDFFPMQRIALEQNGLEIITTAEFISREGITGHLKDRQGKTSFPPHNRTNWDGMTYETMQELQPWLRHVSVMPDWNPDKCLAAFPASRDPESVEQLQALWSNIQSNGGFPPVEKYFGHPTPVDAPLVNRLGENNAGRTALCVYNTTLQQEHILHFHGKPRLGGRLLTHFYTFLIFERWAQDLWTKRFVRDHLRYKNEIQCAAARIVKAVRTRARQRNPDDMHYSFDAFHIRRGEFQYVKTRVSTQEMYEISKEEIPDGTTVYIATDEQNKTFFEDMAVHYDLVYLDDYLHLIPGINSNFFGMIDQLVASRARVFFGCWFSTFSGYINRIRGYQADRLKLKGYRHGLIDSYYYAPSLFKHRMRGYWPPSGALYAREFPVSWRDIDRGINELATSTNESSS